ncbi:hypothetical protein AAFF_G00281800 [Aldrovandia affinis]|uniref:Profilin n=1 Tax=Aldrovandia affinis TaxID=143900 RepID=A0AAD7W284_9TELE|nr:hypothetical protein AAFF_G00281800 [Aldrovandia affinis]
MSWDDFVGSLLKEDGVVDVAIWGYLPSNQTRWAAMKGGELENLTLEEVKGFLTHDRSSLFCNGVTVAGNKCTVVRDQLEVEAMNTLDLHSKGTGSPGDHKPAYVVGTSKSALIVVKGGERVPCNKLNMAVYKMIHYLRDANS